MPDLNVEVVFALAEKQSLVEVTATAGSTVANVIESSGLTRQYPDVDFAGLSVGIWGRVVDRDHVVRSGDRVEIYRSLLLDPREARRQRALVGESMSKSASD